MPPRAPYWTLAASPVEVEQTIKRSRFVTTLAAAGSVEEARALVAEQRALHPQATHLASAYVVGPPETTTLVGASDDGEVRGTAGGAMLKLLRHSGLGDLAATVARYYGGVKLGRHGLVQAYTAGLALALEQAGRAQRVSLRRLEVALGYADLEPARRLCAALGAAVEEERFAAQVELSLRVPEAQLDLLRARLTDACRGALTLTEADEPAPPAPRADHPRAPERR